MQMLIIRDRTRNVLMASAFLAALLCPPAARAADVNVALTTGMGYTGHLRNPSDAPNDTFTGAMLSLRLNVGARFLDGYRGELSAGLQAGPGTLANAMLWAGVDGGPTYEGQYARLTPTLLLGVGLGLSASEYVGDSPFGDPDVVVERQSIIGGAAARYELLAFDHVFFRLGVTYRLFYAVAQEADHARDPSFDAPGLVHDLAAEFSVGAQF